jgi:hypothetical protein
MRARKRDRTATPVDVYKILDEIRTCYSIKTELFDQKKQQGNLVLKEQSDSRLNQWTWLQQQLQKQSQDMFKLQREMSKKQQEE